MISGIIISRGESTGLWATVASLKQAFLSSGIDHEIIVVLDEEHGDYPLVAQLMQQTDFCNVIFGRQGSPALSRNLGADHSKGKQLLFCDAHCVIPETFPGALSNALNDGVAAAFGGTRFLDKITYGCKVDWDGTLWGADLIDPDGPSPFPVVAAGHGAFMIQRDAFYRVGKYWSAMRGWGGEEPQLNFKLWMMGYITLMVPEAYHWHYTPPGIRRGWEQYRERDFVRNFLMVAAAYGSDDWARRVYDRLQAIYWNGALLHRQLLDEVLASKEVADERAFIASEAKYKNIDQLRESLTAAKIAA